MDGLDEQLDLVDGNDVKAGVISRSQIHSLRDNGNRYLRSACAFIRNAKGEYWTPRRTAKKSIAPNGLDFAMAEHMGVNETYLAAAIRGFSEELSMQIHPEDIRLVGILGPLPGLPYFSAIFLHETEIEPAHNTADFQEAH